MRTAVRLVGVYIDFLYLLTVIGLLNHALSLFQWPSDLVAWGVALVTAIALRLIGLSPGERLTAPLAEAVEMSPRPRRLWANALVGALLVLESTKQLVRWTEMERPLPLFGIIPEGNLQVAISIALGVILMAIGILILRLHRSGVYAALVLGAIWLISMLTSWPILAEVIERMVIARRAAQGFPIRDGEVEMMQRIMPAAWVISAVIIMILVMLCYRRSADRSEP